jgi:hypothetical protein
LKVLKALPGPVCGAAAVELADVEVELERLGWIRKLVRETQRSGGGASNSALVLCPGGTTLSVLDGASKYLLKSLWCVDARTGQIGVLSYVITDRARARLVLHQQHAQNLYQAAVWVYVARMGQLGLLRGNDRVIYSQATPADFPSVVVIQERAGLVMAADNGKFSLYVVYSHGTLRPPSAMNAEERIAAVYALASCKLGTGVARLALSFCFGPKPLPSLVASHSTFSGDTIKRPMFAASTALRPGDAVRPQVCSVEIGWRATVCGQDIGVAGVITLTLLELIFVPVY